MTLCPLSVNRIKGLIYALHFSHRMTPVVEFPSTQPICSSAGPYGFRGFKINPSGIAVPDATDASLPMRLKVILMKVGAALACSGVADMAS